MDNDFNVGNPTKENIEYAFKNLVYYVQASCLLDVYKAKKESFELTLKKINLIMKKFVNNGNLFSISIQEIDDIKFDVLDLDVETKELKSYYAEWCLLWIDAIKSLKIVEKRLGNNGK